jgi:hypothetical protein
MTMITPKDLLSTGLSIQRMLSPVSPEIPRDKYFERFRPVCYRPLMNMPERVAKTLGKATTSSPEKSDVTRARCVWALDYLRQVSRIHIEASLVELDRQMSNGAQPLPHEELALALMQWVLDDPWPPTPT